MKKYIKLFVAIFAMLAGIGGFLAYNRYFKSPAPYRILCMGDSITAGDYGNYTETLQKLFLSEGIEVEVISAAKPGYTSGEYLAFLKNSNLAVKEHPDAVVLMLGTNDVRIDGDHTTVQNHKKNIR